MGKKIGTKAATAQQTLLRRAKSDLITQREEAIQTREINRGNNWLAEQLHKYVVAERVTQKINPDGSKMSLKQEIDFRVANNYGTKEYLQKLRDKLEGIDQDQMADVTDEQLLEQLEAAQAA